MRGFEGGGGGRHGGVGGLLRNRRIYTVTCMMGVDGILQGWGGVMKGGTGVGFFGGTDLRSDRYDLGVGGFRSPPPYLPDCTDCTDLCLSVLPCRP